MEKNEKKEVEKPVFNHVVQKLFFKLFAKMPQFKFKLSLLLPYFKKSIRGVDSIIKAGGGVYAPMLGTPLFNKYYELQAFNNLVTESKK